MLPFIKAVLNLLYPPRCVFCRDFIKEEEQGICIKCLDNLSYADEISKGKFFDHCLSALYYEGSVQKAIWRYKFRRNIASAEPFGRILGNSIQNNNDARYDVITWVPANRETVRKRGFDHAELLAKETAEYLGKPELLKLMMWKRDGTVPQFKLHTARRSANVLGAFKMLPDTDIRGLRVLLIDDILTTGATLSECSRVLLTAGATQVTCATLAKTKYEKPKKH